MEFGNSLAKCWKNFGSTMLSFHGVIHSLPHSGFFKLKMSEKPMSLTGL